MRFQVPQFIEQEAKIAGPLTFKQFVMFGLTAGVIMLIYLGLAKANFGAFAVVSVLLTTAIAALAFVKIGGRELPQVLESFFLFFLGAKVYVWRKKALPPRIVWKADLPQPPSKEPASSSLKMVEKSRLKQMATIIETKK